MELILPIAVGAILLVGIIKRVKIFDAFVEGAIEGLHTLYMIIPTITALVVAVEMLQKSGAIELLCNLIEPLADTLGFPKEIVPMAVLRPVSGGGSTAILINIYENYGPESLLGNIASVLAGSTETTFYAVTMYYGSIGVRETRHTLLVGLCADFTALVSAVYITKILV